MSPKALPPSLAETLKQVRQEHPLPGEYLPGDARHMNDLLVPLKKMEAGEWNKFCLHLDQRLERLIFPAFLQVSDSDSLKRLQQLCRERCSWSLYEQGWQAFQENFPNRHIQLAFAEIYAMLRRDARRYGQAPSYIMDYLPARVDFSLAADQLLQNSSLLFAEHMNENKAEFTRVPVSEQTNPYEKAMRAFYRNYNINYKTQFGAALLGKYLLSCDDHVIYEQRQMISDISIKLPGDQFMSFLTRVSQSPVYSEEQRNPLYEIIFHTLEQSQNGADLWLEMPKRTRQNLLRWHIWSIMQEHYAMNPRKERIMMHFSRSITDVLELDSQTVAWRFKNFVILDSWADMDYSYYYPQALFDEYLQHRRSAAGFIDSDIRYRMLSADNYKTAMNGAVRLGFIVPHLEHTIAFISRLSGQKPPTAPNY